MQRNNRTGASFLELFDGDEKKVELLEQKIAEKIGFSKCQSVSGQTYTRKVDFAVLQVLSGIAQSVSKFQVTSDFESFKRGG